jgi:hypothetical protein
MDLHTPPNVGEATPDSTCQAEYSCNQLSIQHPDRSSRPRVGTRRGRTYIVRYRRAL